MRNTCLAAYDAVTSFFRRIAPLSLAFLFFMEKRHLQMPLPLAVDDWCQGLRWQTPLSDLCTVECMKRLRELFAYVQYYICDLPTKTYQEHLVGCGITGSRPMADGAPVDGLNGGNVRSEDLMSCLAFRSAYPTRDQGTSAGDGGSRRQSISVVQWLGSPMKLAKRVLDCCQPPATIRGTAQMFSQ